MSKLPNARLRTKEDIFRYFVGQELGEQVELEDGELWLPVGVSFEEVVPEVEGLSIEGWFEPDDREIEQLLRAGKVVSPRVRAAAAADAARISEIRRRHGRLREIRKRSSGTSPSPGRGRDRGPTGDRRGHAERIGFPMAWQQLHELRRGIRYIARSATHDPVEGVNLDGTLRTSLFGARTSLRDAWTPQLAAVAQRDFELGVKSDVLLAALVLDAMRLFDELPEQEARPESEPTIVDSFNGIPGFVETYPPRTEGRRAPIQRIVAWAERYGVTAPRDLAALAVLEQDVLRDDYGAYLENPKKARKLWSSARAGLFERRKRFRASGWQWGSEHDSGESDL